MPKVSSDPIDYEEEWFTYSHRQQLGDLKPFESAELDQMAREILLRNDSQSSLTGLLKNMIEILCSKNEAKIVTATQLLKTKAFKTVWQFALQVDEVDDQEVVKELDTLLSKLRESTQTENQKPSATILSNELILSRMKHLISKESILKSSPAIGKWFTPLHQKNLKDLKVFDDEEMNEVLQQVLQLPSSTVSLKGVAKNIILSFWREEDTARLSSKFILKNKQVSDVWSFVCFGRKGSKISYTRGELLATTLREIRSDLE